MLNISFLSKALKNIFRVLGKNKGEGYFCKSSNQGGNQQQSSESGHESSKVTGDIQEGGEGV
jgi:hypothetical protein